MSAPEGVAAVDLGSNSFHLLVARVANGVPTIVDRLREQVQLAAGLDADGRLTRRARQRALECLERFGQRLRDLSPERVRAVATSALRDARNAREFLAEADRALGHPIEVVAGREEARLIYLGVSHNLKDEPGRRLVVDIGGGSTECILGERFEPLLVDSLEMGCVAFSRRFFSGGAIRRRRYEEAVLAARLEVRGAATRFKELGWQGAVGSSGTISAVEQAIRGSGWGDSGITVRGLARLADRIIDLGHVDRLDLPGLKEERRPVLPGGLAILQALFEGFGLDRMETSYGALREGVLFDLLGRLQHEDARDRTIRAFEERYHVDLAQAQRVEKTALALLEQVAGTWKLDREEGARFLSWAARLHEIGLVLSFEGHHRHGAYIVRNADMAGFSKDDQELLATLIGAHRRKLRRAEFRHLPPRARETAMRLAVLLRLAVRFHRSRAATPLPAVKLLAHKGGLAVELPEGWLDRNPLTRTDLEAEIERLEPLGFDLQING
ncbi:MAG TPA: exopolyphosphatase [Planctomycetota bacterium]|nr:exopolyphosphatase [Planctomycetota bacterium]